MSVFSRFSDIISANISALLDKAEDPQKMIRLIIQEMEDTLVEVRTQMAKSLADKRELTRVKDQRTQQLEDWQNKVRLALSKDRDDLARAAIIEKNKLAKVVEAMAQDEQTIDDNLAKLSSEVDKLEQKITETRAKQQALLIREQAATSRSKVQSHINRVQVAKYEAQFEQLARKIDHLEGQADVASKPSSELEQAFNDLEAQDEIEQELAAMKAQIEAQKANSIKE
ncbi:MULTISPECIES: phage shock protein PspA [unclassified Vibrio]|uniref:Phage shock protein PspA n=1 Tax=Vibrio sp. HB236076 TaxID=3232307 RepID=A0AB39HE45_9VIBR|nr:phage shock protein PspA [Vibrio sp. HB161653]MDP5253619.1 phage shock protein PspA [Vibrio sp. HB161653]